MGVIFLSYAREDRDFAEKLAYVLEGAGQSVWWDRRLDGGEEFSAEIEAALERSDVVLVAWSTASVKSRWVRDEAAVGGDTGRLVPVTIDGSLPPMGFRQFHTLDLTEWKGGKRDRRTAELLHSVERRLKGKGSAVAATPIAEPKWRFGFSGANRMWAAAALAAIAAGIVAFLLLGRMGNDAASTPSLAIMPFTADASDTEARRLASAAHDAVAHTLSQGAFAVSAIDATPSGSPPPADFLITGRVTSTSGKFVATLRMEEASRHLVVFSHQFETGRDNAGDFAELIGAQVASQVSWTAPLLAVERRHPSDPAVTAALLQSSAAGLDNIGTLHDYETSRRLAAKAPNSPLALNGLAFNTAFALEQIPREERAEAVAAARRAADRAIKLAPETGGNYIPWCLLHSEQRRIECERSLRAGMRADPDASFNDWFLAFLILNRVGRNTDAAELASLSLAHDPYMPMKIGLAVQVLEGAGRTVEASGLYRQSTRWWPKNEAIDWFRLKGTIQRGDFGAAQRFDDETRGQKKPNAVLAAINSKSLSAVRTACQATDNLDAIMCMLALARLGDLDAAYALADRLYPSRRGRTPAEEERIWIDNPGPMPLLFLTGSGAAPLRRDPRYVALAERVGLLEYWRSGRPPDFCRRDPERICAQLLTGR